MWMLGLVTEQGSKHTEEAVFNGYDGNPAVPKTTKYSA